MPFPIIPIAAGVGSIVGNLLNNSANKSSVKLQNEGNMKLAEYSFQKENEMWRQANEYNLPQNQMQRLKDAGLNPNMVYGSQSVTGNTVQPTLPKYNAPRMEAVHNLNYGVGDAAMNALSQYQSLQANQAQVNNVKAMTDNIVAKTITEGLTQSQIAQSTARSQFDLGLAKRLEQTSVDAANANLRKVLNENELFPLQAKNLSKDLDVKQSNILSQEQQRTLQQIQSTIARHQLQNYGYYGKGEAPTVFGVPIEPIRKAISNFGRIIRGSK